MIGTCIKYWVCYINHILSPLKHVAYKTVFLVASTTFQRCSDVQALKLGDGAVTVMNRGVKVVRQGPSKQDRMIHFGSKIFVPSFSENKKLDPKKALGFYLKRTKVFRKTSKDIHVARPPRITKVPDWDLHKVLGMLHKAHFEPLI